MQFELHLFEPVCYIGVVDSFDEDGPGVCVVVGHSCWFGILDRIEGFRACAVHEGTEYGYAFDALCASWWCHGRR